MANRTVGNGKTHSTIAAAIAAASADDTIQIYANGANGGCHYAENLTINKALTFTAMVPGISISGTLATTGTSGTTTFNDIRYLLTAVWNHNTAMSIVWNRSEIMLSGALYLWANTGSTGAITFNTCVLYFPFVSGVPFYVYAGTVNVYHCVAYMPLATTLFSCANSPKVRLANNYWIGGTVYKSGGTPTFVADRNVTTKAFAGSTNNTVTTYDNMDVLAAQNTLGGDHLNFRVEAANEVTGTTSIDSQDLTIICALDINQESRSAHPVGISEGFTLSGGGGGRRTRAQYLGA